MSYNNQQISDIEEQEYNRIISELFNDPFFKRLYKYQLLIDFMLKSKDEAGICRISQKQISEFMKCSQSRVSQMISSINTEDVCIEKINACKYKVINDNIFKFGTFNKILLLYFDFVSDKLDYSLSCKNIAENYNIKIKTVQMFKSYMRLIYNECKDN